MRILFFVCFLGLFFIAGAQTITAKEMLKVINCKDTTCLDAFLANKKDYSLQKYTITNYASARILGTWKSNKQLVKAQPDSLGFNYINYNISRYNYCMSLSITTANKRTYKKLFRGFKWRGFKFENECETIDSECKVYRHRNFPFVELITEATFNPEPGEEHRTKIYWVYLHIDVPKRGPGYN